MGTKTSNYQLNQWEAEDDFLRTDFNEDNAKIDAALGELAQRTGYVLTTYQGNGDSNHVDLGFWPTLMIVIGGGYSAIVFGWPSQNKGISLRSGENPGVGWLSCFTTDETGFTVTHDTYHNMNLSGTEYFCIAFS